MDRYRYIVRIATTIGLLALLMVGAASPAAAHVDLADSDPPDQARLVAAPEVLELTFSAPVDPAGDGIQLVNATGTALAAAVSQPAGERFLVTPTEPLSAGTYGVVWTVRAGDAHPRSGSIAFSIAPPPAPATGLDPAPQPEAAPEPITIAAMAATTPTSGEWLARIGRWVALVGALVGIGALAFAAAALTGSRREVHEAAFWVRRAGLAVIAGSVLDAAGTSITVQGSLLSGLSPGGLFSTLASTLGVAVLLRVAGGVAMLSGAQTVATPLPLDPAPPEPGPPDDEATGSVATLAPPRVVSAQYRLDVWHSGVALAGVAAVAMSYLFDGHTVTATPGWLIRIADLAHVVAAGVWVGGVLMLGRVLTRRWKRGEPLHAAELAIRFSPIAAVALGAVAAAGLALTWMILDTPGELVATEWGRLLLGKLAVVATAAAIGGYNHRNVVPRLAADADDEAAGDMLRRTVRVEGAVLVAVVAVTVLLVGAAS